jgi:hypothetical protein
MANDYTALGSAIYSVLNAAGTVDVHYALAPQGSTPPYCIFQRSTAADDYTFTSSGVSADYIVKVVSNRNWPGEAQEVYGHIHTAMTNAALSVSGYTLIRSRRDTSVEFRDEDGFWHVGGIYNVDIHD